MKQGVHLQSRMSQRLDFKSITKNKLGFDIEQCPCCKTGRMVTVLQIGANTDLVSLPNPPPVKIKKNM
jgi:hypothetical protein